MKLRKQLLIISLISLTLPWAGCQYIREMEHVLQNGQRQALLATSRAVASRLGSDRESLVHLRHFNAPPLTTPVYVYPLRSDILLDGYDDDWLIGSYALQALSPASEPGRPRVRLVTGHFNRSLYLFMRVEDASIAYFNPAQSSPLETDHILLSLVSAAGESRTVALYASGPGKIQAVRLLDQGQQAVEHRIKGSWLESGFGYQVEVQLPLRWAERNFGVSINGITLDNRDIQVTNYNTISSVPPVITQSTPLKNDLGVFTQTGIQLSLASANGKYIAVSGDLSGKASQQLADQHGFINWFYRSALGIGRYPGLDAPESTGNFETPEIGLALAGQDSHGWYEAGNKRVLRVATPIFDRMLENKVIGAVVVDQNADSLATMTNSAFNRLFAYSLLVILMIVSVSILYATWLSLRIRHLSQAAAGAISDSGKVVEDFPVFSSRDEIGDLSRSYAQLLARLREYTNYLRTLSSKLSHELRTPLAIVRSSLDNLEHEKLSSQAKVYSERAREGTIRLSNILNAMSAASRVEQAIGAAELEVIPCDELLRNLKDAYEDVYRKIKITLRIREGDGDLKVLGSGELLVQMLDKLVDNAADFCPKDGLVELGLYRNGNDVIITVRNEGPPLPSHMHGQLFDSMVSVRDKGASEEEGHHLGLGLYIVRLIADFHRGEVQGYNVPDKSGVIFEIRLPAA